MSKDPNDVTIRRKNYATPEDLRESVEDKAYFHLDKYFSGQADGVGAKIAVGVIGTRARAQQAENNKESLKFNKEKFEEFKKRNPLKDGKVDPDSIKLID